MIPNSNSFPYSKLISDFETLRAFTLQLISNVDGEQAACIPSGFRNNLQWQLGHLLFAQSASLYTWSGNPAPYGHGYGDYFGIGSSPTNMDSLAPDWDELMAAAKKHSRGLFEKISDRLDQKLHKPYKFMNIKMTTTGETLPFLLAHEGEHIAHIKRLIKVTMR